eukprot:1946397-Pyramimonas_sp.AAC.1
MMTRHRRTACVVNAHDEDGTSRTTSDASWAMWTPPRNSGSRLSSPLPSGGEPSSPLPACTS